MKNSLMLLVITLVLTIESVQAQIIGDLFNSGGNPIGFTSDDQFLIAPRYELPANASAETPTMLSLDLYRISPFELIESYTLDGINCDGTEAIEFIAISYDTRFIAYVQTGADDL